MIPQVTPPVAPFARLGQSDRFNRGEGRAALCVNFGRKPKLPPQQIAHARKLIDQGKDRQKVAALFKVGRKTLYRALAA